MKTLTRWIRFVVFVIPMIVFSSLALASVYAFMGRQNALRVIEKWVKETRMTNSLQTHIPEETPQYLCPTCRKGITDSKHHSCDDCITMSV